MKDIVSLLLTTTCLGIAGIGIYLYSLNSEENTFDTQKAGKKRNTISNKKEIEVKDDYDDNDYIDQDNIDDSTIKSNYKIKTKSNNNKTKKNTNKFYSSKKHYYY
jgi:hypothetical protein